MDILNQIIGLMNKEEVRHFKLFSSRTQVNGIRKDLKLFDYIRKTQEEYDEEKIFSQLYDSNNKNPYYRLKNRLLGDINKSLNLQHIEDDDVMHIFHLLSLSRFFHQRNNYQVALHYIRKAEKKAIKLENYELLDHIYSELIKLSHEILSINPEEYIRKRKDNRSKLNALREIDDILAAVIYRLKTSLNYANAEAPVLDLLEKTVDDFAQNPNIRTNPKLRFTLYHAVSRILLSRRDYITLEEYLLNTYSEFRQEKLFNKSNHDSKLQMLVYLVNTLYKTRKLDLSLKYAEELNDAMQEYNGFLHKKYLFYYYNSLVINYTQTDPPKCLKLLEQLKKDQTFRDQPFYDFLVMANLSVSYFTARRYSKAMRTLVQVQIHDGYKTASPGFKMRYAVFELVLRLENSDFEIVERRIDKVRKEFSELLGQTGYVFDREFIDIIEGMNNAIEIRMDKALIGQVRAFLETYAEMDSDEFSFIDYRTWLREKTGLRDSLSA